MFFMNQSTNGKKLVHKGLHPSADKNITDNLKKGQICILLGGFKGSVSFTVQPHRILNVVLWSGSLFDSTVLASFETPSGSIGRNTHASYADVNDILGQISNKERETLISLYRGLHKQIIAIRDLSLETNNTPTTDVLVKLFDKQFHVMTKTLEPYTNAYIQKDAEKIIELSEYGKRNGSSEKQSFYNEKAVRLYKTIMLLKVLSPLTFAITTASSNSIYSHTLPLPPWLMKRGIQEIKDAITEHHLEQGINYNQIIKLSGSTDLTRVDEVLKLILVTHISLNSIHKNHPLGSLYTKHFKKGVISQTIRFVTGDTADLPGDISVSETTVTEQLQNACTIPIGVSIEINNVIQSALYNRVPDKALYEDAYKQLKDWSETHFTNKAYPKLIGFHLHVITGIFGSPCHNDLTRDTVLHCLAFMYCHTLELNLPLSFYLPAEPDNGEEPYVNTRCLFKSVTELNEITYKQSEFVKRITHDLPSHYITPFQLMYGENQNNSKHISLDRLKNIAFTKERITYTYLYANFFKSTNKIVG